MNLLKRSYIVLIAGLLFGCAPFVHADTVSDLQDRIQDSNDKIKALEQEITQYQTQLQDVGKQKQTLQQTLQTIDISRKKATADIQVTVNRISSTEAQIQELSYQIGDKQGEIAKDISAVREGLRAMDAQESNSEIETFLSHASLSDYWDALLDINQFQGALRSNINSLNTIKSQLEDAKKSTEDKKTTLGKLQKQLTGQKAVLDANRAEENKLLADTKNKESNFQKILADKVKAKQQFESELLDYESKLKFALDPASIPHSGNGVLSWPFSNDYMLNCSNKLTKALGNPNCVTQTFGDTAFARAGAYSGKGHNGVDFRAPIGTELHAVLSGTVIGTGNTDSVRGCYSYGKWILIRHDNGLASLYGHLSVIGVSSGQHVDTGSIIGYSGQTGYATGPHLHLSIFASQGVQIVKLTQFTGKVTPCANATMPVAPLNAYLDPLQYL